MSRHSEVRYNRTVRILKDCPPASAILKALRAGHVVTHHSARDFSQ